MDYLILFSSAFLSATLLPGSSELVLFGLLTQDTSKPVLLILVASCGNTLGSVTSWLIGAGTLKLPYLQAKMRSKATHLNHGHTWVQRLGYASLLFSWLPVIGDAICIVAGIKKVPIIPFTLLVFLGKTLRYCAVFALYQFGPSAQ